MELKTLCKGCLVVTIAFLFAACNNEQAAKNETTNQEVNMQKTSDSTVLQKTEMKDSTTAKIENEKEENEKDDD